MINSLLHTTPNNILNELIHNIEQIGRRTTLRRSWAVSGDLGVRRRVPRHRLLCHFSRMRAAADDALTSDLICCIKRLLASKHNGSLGPTFIYDPVLPFLFFRKYIKYLFMFEKLKH